MLSAAPYESTAREQAVESVDYVDARLAGTVWQNSDVAHGVYRWAMALGRVLGRIGLTANALTYTSLVLAAVAGVAAATQHFVTAAVILMASGMCDMLDGVVARATNTVTPFGALLDSTVDRFADGLPLLGLVVVYADHGWLASVPALAMLGGLAVSYVRARAESLGARLPALFMRRAERVVLLMLSLLLGVVSLSLSVPAPLLLLGVSVIGLLSLIGVVFALRAARLALGEQHGADVAAAPVSVLDAEASAR